MRVSTTGGIGTVSGILIGVLVFELLKVVLQFLGRLIHISTLLFKGLVIVTAVAIDIRKYVARKIMEKEKSAWQRAKEAQ
ncbi:MAG: hypothetical protein ACOX1L_09195 [Erysipelotrichaceae bacterium]